MALVDTGQRRPTHCECGAALQTIRATEEFSVFTCPSPQCLAYGKTWTVLEPMLSVGDIVSLDEYVGMPLWCYRVMCKLHIPWRNYLWNTWPLRSVTNQYVITEEYFSTGKMEMV